MSPPVLVPPAGEPGLTSEEARARLAEHGSNRLVPAGPRAGPFAWLLRALTDPMALLLFVASGTYFWLGDVVDAWLTLGAVLPIGLVTVVLEVRAERTLEQLKRITAPLTIVWRDGSPRQLPSDELVPGDLIALREGDIVPADGVLVAGAQITVDESALTGESQPVDKDVISGTDQRAMFAGTTVLSGQGVVRLTTTGSRTRYGQIGELVAHISQPPTPLQRLIRRLIIRLAVIATFFCIGVIAVELLRGHGWPVAVIAGVSLAMAAIPEEFPMVFTLYLTLGAWRLARDRALIRRLAGVETLGATTIICADKTGTLTLGHLEVGVLWTPDRFVAGGDPLSPDATRLLEAAVLASELSAFDPLEQAVIRFAAQSGVDTESIRNGTLARDYPFDPIGKYVSHVWRRAGRTAVYAKGATEGILDLCNASGPERAAALQANDSLATDGLRVIAVAGGDVQTLAGDRASDERALRFIGLIAFRDPLRPGVAEALHECGAAGIRVIMITGDHPITAHAVAEGLGISHPSERPVATGEELDAADDAELGVMVREATLFARIRPEQKYRLVRALRAQGEIVAMTGDGINDAPALREADIGVAMGKRGTEVARAAASLVLLDDNFATIVSAVKEGRRIFENLRRSFSYLLAFHVPILLSALVIPMVGAPLLLYPIHLVWLELIVHPTASLVFEADPATPDLMRRPPRSAESSLLSAREIGRPVAAGLALLGGVLAVYFATLASEGSDLQARAAALICLIVGQMVLVMAERTPSEPLWCVGLRGNWALPTVVGGTVTSLVVALTTPQLAGLLALATPTLPALAASVGVALATTLPLELAKLRTRVA